MTVENEARKRRGVGGRPALGRRNYVRIYIAQFPHDVKRRLVAAASNSNLNDVAGAILASRFGTAFMPSGISSPVKPGAEADPIVLYVPQQLRSRLRAAADRRERTLGRRVTVAELVIEALDDELPKDT